MTTPPAEEALTIPHLKGNVLLVGGAGYLGRAIVRRAQREHWPVNFTIFSRDEDKHLTLRERYGNHLQCYLGDILNYQDLVTVMVGMDTVLHMAALKFIPDCEKNVWQCMRVNIDGSRNVLRAAAQSSVQRVIGISTDKASMPVNTYGMTKALMERMFAESNRWREGKQYITVRYGNVIGSTGSVVPVLQRQMRDRGRVTITDPNMTRFWMSADEAIDTILLADSLADKHSGATVIPRCGAMKLGDLTSVLVGDDVPVDIIGVRPGEKLHEDLVNHQEARRCLSQGNYYLMLPGAPRSKDETQTYRSNFPAHTITPERMREMIDDAANI